MELPSDHHPRQTSLEKAKDFLEERQNETHQARETHLRKEGFHEVKQLIHRGGEKEMGQAAPRDPHEVDSDR